MRLGEAAGELAVLVDGQGEPRAGYSLQGFGAAYDVVAEVCSTDVPRLAAERVTVSDVAFSAVNETCFTFPDPARDMAPRNLDIVLRNRETAWTAGYNLCLEFAMEGPFREAGRAERIDVKVAVSSVEIPGRNSRIDQNNTTLQPTPDWLRESMWLDFYSG